MAAFDYRQAREIRDVFAEHGVRYLFLGKSGALLLGFPDTTQDADLFVQKSPENGRATVAALRQLGFKLTETRVAEIERGKDFVQLKCGPFDLDLVFAPDGIETFDDAWKRHVDVEGFPVCHIDDIIPSRGKRTAEGPGVAAAVEGISRVLVEAPLTIFSEGDMTLTRRQFGKIAATAVGGGLLGAALPAAAAQPVSRIGRPYMKLSLAAYSFNRFLPRNWPRPRESDARMTLLDFVDFCAEQDLDGCEPTSYYFPAEVTGEYLMQLKERTFRLGLDISGTAIGNDFCVPEGPEREFQLRMTRQWIDYAAAMGAPVIRIFAGKVPRGDSEAAALDRCVAGINDSLEYAAEKGVVLALENHGGITATPEQLLAIVRRVDDSPWFGVNFDSGNFHTKDPYADLEKIAPYTVNAQIKAAIRREDGPQEEADLERIVAMLKSAGYRGYVVLEYEERDDPWKNIPRYLKELRGLIA